MAISNPMKVKKKKYSNMKKYLSTKISKKLFKLNGYKSIIKQPYYKKLSLFLNGI